VTEVGTNSVEAGEAGQARTYERLWGGIQRSGAIGGVAFEFADEWWKNYENPRALGAWWDGRLPAPGDEAQHDLDPEESYGLVTGERRPKPAFAAVQQMYAPRPRGMRSTSTPVRYRQPQPSCWSSRYLALGAPECACPPGPGTCLERGILVTSASDAAPTSGRVCSWAQGDDTVDTWIAATARCRPSRKRRLVR
jgi:hypothetical protein